MDSLFYKQIVRLLVFFILAGIVNLLLTQSGFAAPNKSAVENTALCYQATISLPKFTKYTDDPKQQTNQEHLISLSQSLVNQVQAEFVQLLSQINTPAKQCPSANTLNIHYQQFTAPDGYVSLQLIAEASFYHNAHLGVSYRVLNYDLQQQKPILLSDLVADSATVLTRIAQYAQADLTKQLIGLDTDPELIDNLTAMIRQGTEPNFKNYQLWNLENNNLVITFIPGQVAPRYFGAQTVIIPMAIIKE